MRFVSRYAEYEAVIVPSTTTYLANGTAVIHKGKSIKFNKGMYETEDKEEIKFLKKHKDFGSLIICVEDLEQEQYKCPSCEQFSCKDKAEMKAHLLTCQKDVTKEEVRK